MTIRCRLDYHPEIPEKVPLDVLNTHFECKNEKYREIQSKILYNKLDERSGSHKILLGDFNADPLGPNVDIKKSKEDVSLERLLRHPNMKHPLKLYEDSTFKTYPSDNPTNLYDAILTSQFLEIEHYYVNQTRVSDHLAVVADINIKPDLVPEKILKKLLTRN